MANLQVDFYRALKTAKISDEAAQKVVEALEGYIAMKVTEANRDLIGKLDSVQKDVGNLRWFLGAMIFFSSAAAGIGTYVAYMIK